MLVTVRYKANDGKRKWRNSYSRYGNVVLLTDADDKYILFFAEDMWIEIRKSEAAIWKIEEVETPVKEEGSL